MNLSGRRPIPNDKADALAKVRTQLRAAVEAGKMTQDELVERFLQAACDMDISGARDSTEGDSRKKLLTRLNRTADLAVRRRSKTFDDTHECHFPYLEQMVETGLFEVARNVHQPDTPFAKMIGHVCMDRILAVQPDYRAIYRIKRDLPSDSWFLKVLQNVEFKRSQFAEGGLQVELVDTKDTVEEVLRAIETCSWDKFWGDISVPAVDDKGKLLYDARGRQLSVMVGGVDRLLYFTKRKQRQRTSTKYLEEAEAACERHSRARAKRKIILREREEVGGEARADEPDQMDVDHDLGNPDVPGVIDDLGDLDVPDVDNFNDSNVTNFPDVVEISDDDDTLFSPLPCPVQIHNEASKDTQPDTQQDTQEHTLTRYPEIHVPERYVLARGNTLVFHSERDAQAWLHFIVKETSRDGGFVS